MSIQYAPVKWNPNKRIYDTALAGGVILFLALFLLVGRLIWRGDAAISMEILLIRAFGTCAFMLLHVVLCIGPLARFDPRFLPLLYNRRHLGVTTFLLSLGHATLAVGYYHGFGRVNPLLSLLTSNVNYGSFRAFPFETFGLVALVILFLMAATSHDFWLKHLSPSIWKSLHMLVYPAYALLVLHVGLGALQGETSPFHVLLLGGGVGTVISLHVAAALREYRREVGGRIARTESKRDEWLDVGGVDEIPNNRGKMVCLANQERVAVFRYDGQISAVTNVCAHQRGPLSEGKIVDGCITCPWHGWDYRPQDGCAPPPFTEKIATYRVRVENRRILLHPCPLPPGTPTEPGQFKEKSHADQEIVRT